MRKRRVGKRIGVAADPARDCGGERGRRASVRVERIPRANQAFGATRSTMRGGRRTPVLARASPVHANAAIGPHADYQRAHRRIDGCGAGKHPREASFGGTPHPYHLRMTIAQPSSVSAASHAGAASKAEALAPHAHLDDVSRGMLGCVERVDPEVAAILAREAERQATTLELIASENHVSAAVMHAAGSWMTNKYAEGYPGKRYYGGCAQHDAVEDLARERAKKLFGCGFANVQPHCGANANIAAFMALMNPGDTVLSLPIKSGGHLSHGLKPNFSGTFYSIVEYGLHPQTELLDYDAIAAIAAECKPKLIICGYSAYSRVIDFARFRAIADSVGAYLMADIAHIAGLVAAGVHPSPFPHAHVVTTTTHKTLRGPRGGLVLSDDAEIANKVDRKVFPGSQGGPLMHIIAAKAVAFGEALKPEFKAYSQQVVRNAQALAAALSAKGYRLCTGGTDNHLMLVDLRTRDANLTGADAEKWLESAGIICNKNGIPNDPRPPMVTSGLRLGTPALTTRGLKEPEMAKVAEWLDRVMGAKGDAATCAKVAGEIRDFCASFPLP